MQINKSTNDALKIVVHCAKADGALVKAAELSRDLDITLQNVLKLVHILSRAGILAPVRGRYGGVTLAREADSISVGAIVRAMEPETFVPSKSKRARSQTDIILNEAMLAFLAILDGRSIAIMARVQTKVLKDEPKSLSVSGGKIRRAKTASDVASIPRRSSNG
jgi:Rrf2 family transcriptional regulator, nitric oxide-sensitive transcriptional repressor